VINRTQLQRLFMATTAIAVITGCASTPLDEKPAPVAEKSAPAPAMPAPAPAPDTRAVQRVDTAPQEIDPLTQPNSPLARRSVFFDFDRFDIKGQFQPVVEAHGRYLATAKQRHIVIEGNADERGSREYNLALGQKRADAVKSRLLLLGATDGQIETISYGEERPCGNGHDEAAWAQNRRADIEYKGANNPPRCGDNPA
jgi:peptidoglycan-associated lipoprotein